MGSCPDDALEVNPDDDDIIKTQCWVEIVGGKKKDDYMRQDFILLEDVY